MRELALFAGAGGGILGGRLLGWRTVCAVEISSYCRRILLARQRDGMLERFPIWDDVSTFDGKPWRGRVDVISGGFPCQDISSAGKGAGLDGARSGLWVEMARIIGEVRPGHVLVENSPMLTSRGLGRVLGDLASMGYDARWGVLGARHVGAPHRRDRIWIVANADGNNRWSEQKCKSGSGDTTNTRSNGSQWRVANSAQDDINSMCERSSEAGVIISQSAKSVADRYDMGGTAWASEPGVGRVADGMASWVDRLKAIGNGQVPAVAALAWRLLR